MITIKKYSNRRLYDTSESRYVTLEELAEKIRAGADVQVQDASTGADLTQNTLAQIIMESRGAAKLLPIPLLTQMIRMGDDALAEFLGQFLSMALGLYLQAKRGAQTVAPYYPFATAPFAAADMLARMLGGAWPMNPMSGAAGWNMPFAPHAAAPPPHPAQGFQNHAGWGPPPPPPSPTPPPSAAPPPPEEPARPQDAAPPHNEIAALRRELEALKKSLGHGSP